MSDLVLCYELKTGGKLYVNPEAIESIRESRKMLRTGETDVAGVTTASGGKHLILDKDRTAGPRWITAVQRLMEAQNGRCGSGDLLVPDQRSGDSEADPDQAAAAPDVP